MAITAAVAIPGRGDLFGGLTGQMSGKLRENMFEGTWLNTITPTCTN